MNARIRAEASIRTSAPALHGHAPMGCHDFCASVLGEVFDCALTWRADGPALRWTVVAMGHGRHSLGLARTGVTILARSDRRIEGDLERDACAGILAELISIDGVPGSSLSPEYAQRPRRLKAGQSRDE